MIASKMGISLGSAGVQGRAKFAYTSYIAIRRADGYFKLFNYQPILLTQL